mmetsp:Transcript_21175/g.71168  ORF Transcript_21175/g.71168 Transcript_21175/m.71168 type:complete len:223 (+) Transcript_21175:154-822(+)
MSCTRRRGCQLKFYAGPARHGPRARPGPALQAVAPQVVHDHPPVDGQRALSPQDELLLLPRVGLDVRAERGDALLCRRVCGEPLLQPSGPSALAQRALQAEKLLEEGDHARGAHARVHEGVEPLGVRLELVGPGEFQTPQLQGPIGQGLGQPLSKALRVGLVVAVVAQERGHEGLHQLALDEALLPVPGQDVPHFVCQHPGQLLRGVQRAEQPGMHKHIAPR